MLQITDVYNRVYLIVKKRFIHFCFLLFDFDGGSNKTSSIVFLFEEPLVVVVVVVNYCYSYYSKTVVVVRNSMSML
jgi:hypothetical protein